MHDSSRSRKFSRADDRPVQQDARDAEQERASTERPIRVAIIGGGCAGMTTAWELTRPEHRGRYEVTVYQAGWRVGGKGASGRGASGRIEEHGLHLWMGFYENAFRLMRECYAELGRDPNSCPIATWEQAFTPAPVVAVADRTPNGDFSPWVAHFPSGEGLPGDADAERKPFSVAGYLRQSVALVGELLRSAHANARAEDPERPLPRHPLEPTALINAVESLMRYGSLATSAALHEAIDLLQSGFALLFPSSLQPGGPMARLVDAIDSAARARLDTLVESDPEARRVWTVIDLILAILRGSIRFGLALDPRGFDAINDYDWREWLQLCGASETSLQSGFLRGIYDLVFAFEDGDPARPSLAAGVALRGALRMFFTYRGALFWRMNAGMGDIVFAPLYEGLERRGVRFEFFHRLRHISLGDDTGNEAHVERLAFDVQAAVRGGGAYRPLVDIGGLPCWPATPDWAQLEEGATLANEGLELEAPWEKRAHGHKELLVGRDFDFVVLAVGVAAIPEVASELIARSQRWRDLVERVKTVPTQAFQLWLHEETRELGWSHPQVNLSGYVEPFDTWADMSHLAPCERWSRPVRSIAYFCSVLRDRTPSRGPDAEFHAQQRAAVRENAMRFIDRDLRALWPRAFDADGTFRWQLLAADAAPSNAHDGQERFDTQFYTANVAPSDRYSLSAPGTIRYRLSPLDRSFDNLTVAGDWTQSGLDSGCVESAVMSGLLAAHALSTSPPLESIIGYDHP